MLLLKPFRGEVGRLGQCGSQRKGREYAIKLLRIIKHVTLNILLFFEEYYSYLATLCHALCSLLISYPINTEPYAAPTTK